MCLILVLGLIIACPILILSHFEAYQNDTFHCDTSQCETTHFETWLIVSNETRKGEKFQMKKSSIEFVKEQLEEIRVSKNAEYSSGIAATLLAYINAEVPAEITKVFIDNTVKPANIINAIKEVRHALGLGLREAKDAVEQGHMVYEGSFSGAIAIKKKLEPHMRLRIESTGAAGALFNS